MRLLINALLKLLGGLFIIAAVLFASAGSLQYWNAWLLLALLFIPMLAAGWVLWRKAPELLEKRLGHREKEAAQRKVIALSGAMFLAGFIVAGLDFRYGWSRVPLFFVTLAALVFLLGYALYALVLRQNAWLARTVEVQQGQHLVDTGVYGVVRHPMYTATLLLFMTMPLILGSWFALLIFLAYPLIIRKRILNEEAVLKAGLPGYADYLTRVRWRLIPYLW